MTSSNSLAQEEVINWFVNEISHLDWIPLYIPHPGMLKSGCAIFACLVDLEFVDSVLSDSEWTLKEGQGAPSLSGAGSYSRTPSYLGVEALIHVQDFQGLHDPVVTLSEELRLLFNLFEDTAVQEFNLFEDDGSRSKAIRYADGAWWARSSLIYRYIAARQVALMFQIESDVWIYPDDGSELPEEETIQTDSTFAHFWANRADDRAMSRLLGKQVVLPSDKEQCGIWPFTVEQAYPEFIVAEDSLGNPIMHSSDPYSIPSRVIAGKDNPHSLTPLFFNRSVLDKYYSDTSKYEISESSIRFGDIWYLRADLSHPEHVAVFLGDLGNELPVSEQRHWRASNVSPVGRSMSETYFAASIERRSVPSTLPEHRLKTEYNIVNTAWIETFGWPLFKELHRLDQHCYSALRVPTQNSISAFDQQVGYLTKLLIDSINEEAIVAAIGKDKASNEKGIGKLERFLATKEITGRSIPNVKVLRDLQASRSKGAAHRRGSDYDLSKAGIDENDLAAGLVELFNRISQMLATLSSFARSVRKSGLDCSESTSSDTCDDGKPDENA